MFTRMRRSGQFKKDLCSYQPIGRRVDTELRPAMLRGFPGRLVTLACGAPFSHRPAQPLSQGSHIVPPFIYRSALPLSAPFPYIVLFALRSALASGASWFGSLSDGRGSVALAVMCLVYGVWSGVCLVCGLVCSSVRVFRVYVEYSTGSALAFLGNVKIIRAKKFQGLSEYMMCLASWFHAPLWYLEQIKMR